MKFEFMVDDITSTAVVVGNAGMSPVDVHVGRLGLTFMEKLRADDPARRPIRWELRVLPFAEVENLQVQLDRLVGCKRELEQCPLGRPYRPLSTLRPRITIENRSASAASLEPGREAGQ